jgi:hypothetical protein
LAFSPRGSAAKRRKLMISKLYFSARRTSNRCRKNVPIYKSKVRIAEKMNKKKSAKRHNTEKHKKSFWPNVESSTRIWKEKNIN